MYEKEGSREATGVGLGANATGCSGTCRSGGKFVAGELRGRKAIFKCSDPVYNVIGMYCTARIPGFKDNGMRPKTKHLLLPVEVSSHSCAVCHNSRPATDIVNLGTFNAPKKGHLLVCLGS